MDLPVIETPVAPRWVWMEEVTYSHIPIATLITASRTSRSPAFKSEVDFGQECMGI
jgi:hypothetical protein